jgi:hypothetical protein
MQRTLCITYVARRNNAATGVCCAVHVPCVASVCLSCGCMCESVYVRACVCMCVCVSMNACLPMVIFVMFCFLLTLRDTFAGKFMSMRVFLHEIERKESRSRKNEVGPRQKTIDSKQQAFDTRQQSADS